MHPCLSACQYSLALLWKRYRRLYSHTHKSSIFFLGEIREKKHWKCQQNIFSALNTAPKFSVNQVLILIEINDIFNITLSLWEGICSVNNSNTVRRQIAPLKALSGTYSDYVCYVSVKIIGVSGIIPV
jgi:hypothetical protein